jgi:hypothetical protein
VSCLDNGVECLCKTTYLTDREARTRTKQRLPTYVLHRKSSTDDSANKTKFGKIVCHAPIELDARGCDLRLQLVSRKEHPRRASNTHREGGSRGKYCINDDNY